MLSGAGWEACHRCSLRPAPCIGLMFVEVHVRRFAYSFTIDPRGGLLGPPLPPFPCLVGASKRWGPTTLLCKQACPYLFVPGKLMAKQPSALESPAGSGSLISVLPTVDSARCIQDRIPDYRQQQLSAYSPWATPNTFSRLRSQRRFRGTLI